MPERKPKWAWSSVDDPNPHYPTDDERDGMAKALCAIETRSKAATLEEVQAGIQRWTRHRYEADRLIEELADAGFEVRRTVQGEPELFECPNCLIDVTPPTTNREDGSRDV